MGTRGKGANVENMPLGNRSRRKDILQPFRIFYSLVPPYRLLLGTAWPLGGRSCNAVGASSTVSRRSAMCCCDIARCSPMGSVNEKLAAPDMARQLGLIVAINSIAAPDWDKEHLRLVREWAISQIQGG